MSALGNIIKKELRELLTPATILPIVFIALIFGYIWFNWKLNRRDTRRI